MIYLLRIPALLQNSFSFQCCLAALARYFYWRGVLEEAVVADRNEFLM